MKEVEIEKILKALANRRRLAILNLLSNKKELAVNTIAKQIKLSFRSTSKHLSILYAVNLLSKEQNSLLVFYRLNPNGHKIISAINSFL